MKKIIFFLLLAFLFVNSCKWDLELIKAPDSALPEAGFSLNNNFCVAPCDPGFINLSKNATSFVWDWGDGTPQSTLTPTDAIAHIYASEGTYNVVLTASNGEDFVDFSQTVTIFGSVAPSFTISNDGCKADCEITFQNTSTGADNYEWDFGDGSAIFSTSSMDDVRHTYIKGGTYQISLTATGPGSGTPATVTEDVTINFNTFEFTNTVGYSVTGFEDQDGNYIIAGNSWGSPGDGKWIKLDKTGNLLWSKTIPTQMNSFGTDITSIVGLPNGEMVSTGCINCAATPVTWSFFYHEADGELREVYNVDDTWNPHCFNGGEQTRGTSLLLKENGNIAGVAERRSNCDPVGLFVEFENGTNNIASTDFYDGGRYQFVYQAPSNKNIYVLVNSEHPGEIPPLSGFIQNISSNIGIGYTPHLFVDPRQAYSMVENGGNLAFTGFEGNTLAEGLVLFGLVDLDLTNLIKVITLNTTGHGVGYSIIATEDGGFVLTGDMTNGSTQDAFLIKVDQTGLEEWREFYGGTSLDESGRQVIQTSDGGFLIVIRGTNEFYVVKTDDKGKV